MLGSPPFPLTLLAAPVSQFLPLPEEFTVLQPSELWSWMPQTCEAEGIADFSLPMAPESCSAHLLWFSVEAEHVHRGSTPKLWRSRNSIYLFTHSRGELQPLYPPRASSRSAISPASGVWAQISLPPLGAGEAQSWWPLSRAQGHSQREGGPTPAAEILTNSACFLQKPHFSSLLYPGRDLVFYDSAQTRGTGISQCLSYSSDI